MRKKNGFSLIELAVVLVILGLLAGGILAGKSLIRASELRAVVAEGTRYTTAVQSFREQYAAVPGDMKNATKFWGAQDVDPATCRATASVGVLTCNGNGDGYISAWATVADFYERFRFWQQLANAGLIEGHYSGVSTPVNTNDSVIGDNIPKSKLSPAGWTVYYIARQPVSTQWFAGIYGNTLTFGAQLPNEDTVASVLKPTEAWNVDAKMDDGKPGTGTIRQFATPPDGGGCATTTDPATAVYPLSLKTVGCVLIFTRAT